VNYYFSLLDCYKAGGCSWDSGSKVRASSCLPTQRQSVSKLSEAIKNLHDKACLEEQSGYVDPDSGRYVMTEYYLKKRGVCCQSGCRHCPYPKMEKNND
jgi:hypothetical protein